MKAAVSPPHGRRCFHLKTDFLYETAHEKGKIKAMIKTKKILSVLLITIVAFAAMMPITMANAQEYIKSDTDFYLLENDYIKVSIYKKTGFIKDIYNKKTGISHKSGSAGNWPFQITLSNQTTAGISANTKNQVSSAKITVSGGNQLLQITYDNLVSESSAAKTGVKAVVIYTIEQSTDYFKFQVKFENKGSSEIHKISLCEGGSLKAGGTNAKMVAPLWGEMAYWDNPAAKFSSATLETPYRMSYPGMGWNDLEMGFLDLSGSKGGIGVAYINKQQTVMDFRIACDNGGMSFSPTLLNPEIRNMTVPVKPGESFDTDEVVIAAHEGDWHRMADIYRAEYQKAFTINGKSDYLTWNTLSQSVKDTDVMLRFHETKFSQVFGVVQDKLSGWKNALSAKRVMVWYSGQNQNGYGHDTPTMIPVNPKLGTVQELKKLSEDLHSVGANIFHYEHPYAFAADSTDYPSVSSANPNQSSAVWDGVNHYYLCIDNNEIMNLWKNKLIPDIKATKPDGLQFDQGSLQFTVCDIEGHNHGLDALSRLSSHTKSMIKLTQYVRSNLNTGKTSYIVSEGFNDLTCRYIDMSQTRWDKEQEPVYGGELIYGGRQYVFPQYRNHYNSAAKKSDGVWKNMRQYIAIIGGIAALNEGEDYVANSDTEYIWFKNEMRAKNAPGYPYNFRDNVGITTNSTTLDAKVFTEGNRATITFWANGKKQVDTEVTIQPSKLGLSGKNATYRFDLSKNKTGYIIVNTATGKVESSSVTIKNLPASGDNSSSAAVLQTSSGNFMSSSDENNITDSSAEALISDSTVETGSQNTQSDNQTISNKNGKQINWVLIVAVVCGLLIVAGAILFVLITETPKPLYEAIHHLFRKNR